MPSEQSVFWRQQYASGNLLPGNDTVWPPQPLAIPLPNLALREASSVGEMDTFLVIGEAWAHMVSHFLPENPAVLDIGCGCGKLARFLYLNPRLTYVGVDLFYPAIEWSRKAFAPLCGERFRFEHFDGYSSVYNPSGKVAVADYRLPCENGSVNTVVCASLFTHLLEPDCVHYLSEIRRTLAPGGKAVISIHSQPAGGTVFSGNEARIDIEPKYFFKLAGDAGLRLAETVGTVYGQQVFVFQHDS
jgi:SAM-dependent methyltransferase